MSKKKFINYKGASKKMRDKGEAWKITIEQTPVKNVINEQWLNKIVKFEKIKFEFDKESDNE